MKSGTTSLFEILSQHPEVCPSNTKEPDFFIVDRDEYAREDYLSLWDWQDNEHLVALESSVAYTKMPFFTGVPARINAANLGSYRFIYMLRNPLTRIESQIRHGLFSGWGESLDICIPEDAINYSRYSMQIEEYLKYFKLENFMLITLEEFRNNPDAILSNICEFLAIDKSFQFRDVGIIKNSGDFFNAPPIISLLSQGKIKQYFINLILSKKVKHILRNTISQLGKSSKKSTNLRRWKLTVGEGEEILKILSNDLKRLETVYGVNLHEHWNIQANIHDKES